MNQLVFPGSIAVAKPVPYSLVALIYKKLSFIEGEKYKAFYKDIAIALVMHQDNLQPNSLFATPYSWYP